MGRDYIGAETDEYYQEVSQAKLMAAQPTIIGNAYVSVHLNKVVSVRDCDIEGGIRWKRRAS